MSTELSYIRELVLREIEGNLRDEDRVFLMNAVQQNEAARELRDKTIAKARELDAYFTENPDDVRAGQIFKVYRRRKIKRRVLRSVAVSFAASLLIFLGIKMFSFQTLSHSREPEIATNKQNPTSIMLLLPNGKQLNLDSATRQVQLGNITVKTKNKTLSYQPSDADSHVHFAKLIVPPGKDYKIQLNDGSEVHLNAATELRFPLSFPGNSREIELNGEAYIKVVKNSQKPFLIHLPHGTIEVLGTEFNVNTYDSGVHKIALVSGAVKVNAYGNNIILKPGLEAMASDEGIVSDSFDESDVLSWKEGKYFFTNARMADVGRVVSRWYGIQIVFDNSRAAEQRFSGMISRNKPVDQLLKGLKLTGIIDFVTDEKGVIHVK